jgi:DNA-binding NtrC family response regulator
VRAPDLVLPDVAMPRTSGLDVLAAIRERELDMAVVLTTGLGSEEVAVAALRLRAGTRRYVDRVQRAIR